MEAAIQTAGLTKDYGQHHGIFDLNLEVNRGEAFGFIGPNGAGKTTTMRLLMDLIRADSCTAQIMGLDSRSDSVAIKKITGYLPAESPDYPNHTGERILDLLAHLRGGVDAKRINDLAERLGLDLHRKYRQYSHGNKQKIWLIQAFMHEPQLLILDEPTTGLDPLVQQTFRELVVAARERGATVFLSSHVLSEVQEMCDRIAVVHEGDVRHVGTLGELRVGNVHRVDATTEDYVDAQVIAKLPGVSEVNVVGKRLICMVNGAMDGLLNALHAATIVSLESTSASLEEVFLAEYGNGARR